MADVVHRPEQSRFEAEVAGGTAYLSYEQDGGTASLLHTIVPREAEGQGVGASLAAAAVGWARAEGLAVDPQCSYVRAWLDRQR